MPLQWYQHQPKPYGHTPVYTFFVKYLSPIMPVSCPRNWHYVREILYGKEVNTGEYRSHIHTGLQCDIYNHFIWKLFNGLTIQEDYFQWFGPSVRPHHIFPNSETWFKVSVKGTYKWWSNNLGLSSKCSYIYLYSKVVFSVEWVGVVWVYLSFKFNIEVVFHIKKCGCLPLKKK